MGDGSDSHSGYLPKHGLYLNQVTLVLTSRPQARVPPLPAPQHTDVLFPASHSCATEPPVNCAGTGWPDLLLVVAVSNPLGCRGLTNSFSLPHPILGWMVHSSTTSSLGLWKSQWMESPYSYPTSALSCKCHILSYGLQKWMGTGCHQNYGDFKRGLFWGVS